MSLEGAGRELLLRSLDKPHGTAEVAHPTGICAQCGEALTRHKFGIAYETRPAFRKRKFCSNDCYNKSRALKPPKLCVQCGITVTSRRHGKRIYCSHRCYAKSLTK